MKYYSKQSVSSGRTLHYIKLFESFNDFSNIKNDIRDIFVELIDERFKISFRPNFIKNFKEGNFSICLLREENSTSYFQISEVYEYIMMLIDFVESVGINSKVLFHVTTRDNRDMSYIKKMSLPQLEKFAEEGKPINFIEIVFEKI